MTKKIIIIISLIISVLAVVGIAMYLRQQTLQQSIANNVQMITPTTTQAQPSTSISSVATDAHPGMKLYRNDEFGFEFWYPEGWEWKNGIPIKSDLKLNMIIVKIDGKNTNQQSYISIFAEYPDFLKYNLINMQRLNAKKSEIAVDNFVGIQYRYNFEGMKVVDTSFLFGKFRIVFSTEEKYDVGFSQILSTFKFIK